MQWRRCRVVDGEISGADGIEPIDSVDLSEPRGRVIAGSLGSLTDVRPSLGSITS